MISMAGIMKRPVIPFKICVVKMYVVEDRFYPSTPVFFVLVDQLL